ncbi:MAG: hypothetical protein AAB441_00265 [Patescibacteria group bacterium]
MHLKNNQYRIYKKHRNVVKFLTEEKHIDIQEANLELFKKIHILFKKKII